MSEGQPYFSICMPAYKQPEMIRRLLDSIQHQSFRDFEVIITDDSPGSEVEEVAENFKSFFTIRYYKNLKPLGTPENWNQAIRYASGKWIKMMHQDDWFASDQALETFYQFTNDDQGISFFFSAFANIDAESGKKELVNCSSWQLFLLRISPLYLFKKVYVGNPSCTLIRNDQKSFYDNRLKFVVDFEYYIRCFQSGKKWKYIPARLINVGFHPDQVTKFTFLVPEVQIPENNLLIGIFGEKILNNLLVFDYYWRMYRNLGIRNVKDAKSYDQNQMPALLEKILRFQLFIPLSLLRIGIISKILMSVAYLLFRARLL
jgi:glycosyltransferase involved in cell wall biosynthesis